MPCRATQDEQGIVESSDKMWSTGEGTGKPFQYSCLENSINNMIRKKDRTLTDELPGWYVPNMLLEISGEITPERMKRLMGLPGGPVAKTLCSQCRKPGFDPWSGN